jgi:hypothetical protein
MTSLSEIEGSQIGLVDITLFFTQIGSTNCRPFTYDKPVLLAER